MREIEPGLHLSQIETCWSLVLEAHQGPDDRRIEAMGRLMRRYGLALDRYLGAVLGDPDAAADVSQELALRLVRGDFHSASPDRGRFRQLIKTAALNLVVDHHRRCRARPATLGSGMPELADQSAPPEEELDRQFEMTWRSRLLKIASASLARHEARTKRPLYTVLRLRCEHPGLTSAELAAKLEGELGRSLTAGWVRQSLLRARERYASSLLNEVWRSLDSPSPEALEEELSALGLLVYCRRHLSRFGMGD